MRDYVYIEGVKMPSKMHSKGIVKIFAGVLTVFAGLMLSACGSEGENVASGMNFIKDGKYSQAVECFEKAKDAGENERLIARGLGIAYMGLYDYPQAIDYFVQCLNLSDGFVQDIDFDVNYYLAAAYMKNGQAAEAVETYDAILYFKEDDVDTLFLHGTALLAADNPRDALANFDKVQKLAPKDYNRLVEIYKILDQYSYSSYGREYLTSAIEAGQGKMSDYELGMIYFYLKDYKNAYSYLENARRDGTKEACYYLGKAYEETGDYNYALSVYESFINNISEDALIYNQMGLCKMKVQDYDGALKAFQNGMMLASDLREELSFNEIVAYEHLGDFDNAKALIEAFVATYPENEAGRRERDFLASR